MKKKKQSVWYNKKLESCPQKHLHTPCPEHYIAWHEWAEAISETHNQKECPGCGLWAVWEPKEGCKP